MLMEDIIEHEVRKSIEGKPYTIKTEQEGRRPVMVFVNGILQAQEDWAFRNPCYVRVQRISDGDTIVLVMEEENEE